MTGLSRKEIRRIREDSLSRRCTPDMQASPANTVIHYWYHDPEFCDGPGKPKVLPYQGEPGFVDLVKKYAGDIPPGAMRTELCRTGAVSEQADKLLRVEKHFLHPQNVHDDFVHGIAFSWGHLGNTLVHNLQVARQLEKSGDHGPGAGRLERAAWTERLDLKSSALFRDWAREEASTFIERADHWIGQHELPFSEWNDESRKAIGIGVYFFEED